MMRTDRMRQKRHLLPGLWLAAMLLMLSLTAGCGKSGKNAQSEPAAPAKTEFELAEPEKDLAQELLEAAGQHPEELQGIAEAVLQAAGENPEAAQHIAEAVLEAAGADPEQVKDAAGKAQEALRHFDAACGNRPYDGESEKSSRKRKFRDRMNDADEYAP